MSSVMGAARRWPSGPLRAERLDHRRGSQRARARPTRGGPGPKRRVRFGSRPPGRSEPCSRRRTRGRGRGGPSSDVARGSLEEWWEAVIDTSRMLSEVLPRVGPDDRADSDGCGTAARRPTSGRDGSLAVPSLARVALAVHRSAHGRLRMRMARAGLEPATPRFSAVCSTN